MVGSGTLDWYVDEYPSARPKSVVQSAEGKLRPLEMLQHLADDGCVEPSRLRTQSRTSL